MALNLALNVTPSSPGRHRSSPAVHRSRLPYAGMQEFFAVVLARLAAELIERLIIALSRNLFAQPVLEPGS